MLFSILANLIISYGLVSWPSAPVQTIDVSDYFKSKNIKILKNTASAAVPIRNNINSLGMVVTAESAMIIDKKSGFVLWQKNPDQARSLASITKLITALVFLDHNPGWESEVTMETGDFLAGGDPKVYRGEKIKIKDLFNASLVVSSNTATMALARSSGLSMADFVKEMNLKAKWLGMNESFFMEPTGLEPSNISTATDVLKLAQAAFNREEIRQATVQKEYKYTVAGAGRNVTLGNTDKLLFSYLNIQAGKTGYLDEAGYCLVSQIKGNSNQEILLVVMGSSSETDRFQDIKALAQWTFDNYTW